MFPFTRCLLILIKIIINKDQTIKDQGHKIHHNIISRNNEAVYKIGLQIKLNKRNPPSPNWQFFVLKASAIIEFRYYYICYVGLTSTDLLCNIELPTKYLINFMLWKGRAGMTLLLYSPSCCAPPHTITVSPRVWPAVRS